MKLQTKYFGEIDYESSEVIRFPTGMFGFDDEHDFLLLPFEGSVPMSVRSTLLLIYLLLSPMSCRP